MKLDMHVHTVYSGHSLNSIDKLKKICFKKGITPVITDHNTIKGALKFNSKIIGEEIETKQGEVTGLFLNEEIPKNLDVMETIDRIKKQGGLVYIPHPFDKLRVNSLCDIVFKIKSKIDILEVFNSRTIFKKYDKIAMNFANEYNIIKSVGSDAHIPLELGNAYLEIEDFNSKKEFLINLKKAKFFCKTSPLYIHAFSKFLKLKNLFLL